MARLLLCVSPQTISGRNKMKKMIASVLMFIFSINTTFATPITTDQEVEKFLNLELAKCQIKLSGLQSADRFREQITGEKAKNDQVEFTGNLDIQIWGTDEELEETILDGSKKVVKRLKACKELSRRVEKRLKKKEKEVNQEGRLSIEDFKRAHEEGYQDCWGTQNQGAATQE